MFTDPQINSFRLEEGKIATAVEGIYYCIYIKGDNTSVSPFIIKEYICYQLDTEFCQAFFSQL